MFKSVTEKEKEAYEILKEKFGYKNRMQSPRLLKVVISSGVGSFTDKNKAAQVKEKLALITGQAPASITAKKSVAGFKVREGQLSSYKITLRGKRASDFVDKLIHVALPRTRDFRGLSRGAADEMGNYTLGIKENSIFPETADQDIKDIFGMSITFVTSAKSKEEVIAFLEIIGLPLKAV